MGSDVEAATRRYRAATDVLAIAAIVFAAAFLGILSRPIGFLAAVWPANALLLGLMVRIPRFSRLPCWAGAFAGYIAADLITGDQLRTTLWLTSANMAGVLVGVLLFRRLTEADRRLRRPLSVLYLFAITIGASTAAGLVGAGAAHMLFNRELVTGFGFWLITELANYMIILPAILAAPDSQTVAEAFHHHYRRSITPARLRALAPFSSLLVLMLASIFIGGPAALVYPLPALLWCALSYSLFTTILISFCFSTWQLIAYSAGIIGVPPPSDIMTDTISIRLGITLLALGPLTIASINAARNELLRKLDHAASHDHLTGALARSTFMERADQLMSRQSITQAGVAVLMLDIDHFKTVNDRFGHAAGDRTLATFAAVVSGALRTDDLLARLGGEEFAIVLAPTSEENSLMIAERLRQQVSATEIALDDGDAFSVTVSVGIAWRAPRTATPLGTLLAAADAALYRAKADGRNRVSTAP